MKVKTVKGSYQFMVVGNPTSKKLRLISRTLKKTALGFFVF